MLGIDRKFWLNLKMVKIIKIVVNFMNVLVVGFWKNVLSEKFVEVEDLFEVVFELLFEVVFVIESVF